jgi:hypothetical protein
MKIQMNKATGEKVVIDTDFIWQMPVASNMSFNTFLLSLLNAHKTLGYVVSQDFSNMDAIEYLEDNFGIQVGA